MIKENQRVLNTIQIFIDMLTVVVSFLIAYYLKFNILNGISSMSFYDFFIPIIVSIPMYFILYSSFGLYELKRSTSIYNEVIGIINTNFIVLLIFILFLFIFKIINFSRTVLFLFFLTNVFMTSFLRIIIRISVRKSRMMGLDQKRCVILGATDISKDLIRSINNNKHWGYNIDCVLDNKIDGEFCGCTVKGGIDDLDFILEDNNIGNVFIALNQEDFYDIGDLIYKCEKAGVKSNIVPYYQKYIPSTPYIDDLGGITVIDTRYVPLDNKFNNFIKRSFDIVFSLFAIILTSPIMIFSAIMIKLTSTGPIIYKQERVGLNRRNFYMYKFRSMKVQKEDEEKTKWTTKDDPRKTKWGSFMRKTSIDELPQFFNVLKGDMSIVGPRPERPFFVDKFKEEIPRYMIKHQVRPGITGWAQISGYRGDTSIEGRIEYDLYYIENWDFIFDLKIIFLTIFKGFISKNAY